MYEIIALYRASSHGGRIDLFEVVWGTKADWPQACQAAQRILTGSDPGFRPLRVRIQAVRVTSA
jgi:hypothetical protein